MDSEKIKFGKMLKLIVASEFPRSRHWSFTFMAVMPVLIFILGTFQFLSKQHPLPSSVGTALFVILFIISHFILKKYAKKWQQENKHALKVHAKKILNHFLIYMVLYWGITILTIFTFAKG